jgi:hypothetical protein
MTSRSPLKATENVMKLDEDQQPVKKADNPYGPEYPKGMIRPLKVPVQCDEIKLQSCYGYS